MKKSLVALAVLAAAGAASAQSSVTLFGIVDTGVSYYSSSSAAATTTLTPNPLATVLAGGPAYTLTSTPYRPSVSRTVLSNSGESSSRLGFRGTEDLGGGLAASFWLEAGLGSDNGSVGGSVSNNGSSLSGFFNRRSTVSLSGGFGEIRLGRDYSPTFWNDTVYDPYGTVGVGTNVITKAIGGQGMSSLGASSGYASALPGTGAANGNYVRNSNSIGYFLPPNLGGFYGQLQYAFGENPSTSAPIAGTYGPQYTGIGSKAGTYAGGRFGYTNGPLDVALSYGQWTLANAAGTLGLTNGAVTNFLSAYDAKQKVWNLGGSYDFGVVKLVGEYSQAKTDASQPGIVSPVSGGLLSFGQSATNNNKGFLLGALIPVGPGTIKVSYSQVKGSNSYNSYLTSLTGDPKASQIALGYVYNLSKRTALYATYAHVQNKNGAAIGVDPGGATTVNPNANANGYDFGLRHAF